MIRGIDSQVMINKSMDYARQMSEQTNTIQQSKEFVAEMEKVRIEHEDNSVTQTDKTEQDRIRREQEKQNGKDGSSHQEEPEEEEAEEIGMKVPRIMAKQERDIGGSVDINV